VLIRLVSEDTKFYMFIGVMFSIILVLICGYAIPFWHSSTEIRDNISNHFSVRAGIIRSPAVLEEVKTFTEFDELWKSFGKCVVYEYAGSLYIIPDARIGYFYTPYCDKDWWNRTSYLGNP